jgi:hypothetical protein
MQSSPTKPWLGSLWSRPLKNRAERAHFHISLGLRYPEVVAHDSHANDIRSKERDSIGAK